MTEDLAAAFAILTSEDGSSGFAPFRWQTRLYRQLVEGDPPPAVDVPTGLGKTAVMALWLIALATGARLPRRLVYVVDRRAVVDQATRFAERLRGNLPASLAEKLGLKLDEDTRPLPISTLRGGFADNRQWLDDPSAPAIVVGTVDMVGSRLLFEGYGVSRGMRPYQAGFLGVDTLVVLDEAHLCPPFEALLRQVESMRDGALGAAGNHYAPDFKLMSLSATGRDAAGGEVFRLNDDDRQEALVRERLSARKRLCLVELEDAKNLVACVAEKALHRGAEGNVRVLVYCNSRKDAVAVKALIDKSMKPRSRKVAAAGVSELLVGARRVHERQQLERWLEQHGFLASRSSPFPSEGVQEDLLEVSQSTPTPAYLIATSAGEVGIDMDADHMVCDLVAWERMVQRLGRVNRRGGSERQACVDVFFPADQDDLQAATLQALRSLPRTDDGEIDASPRAVSALQAERAALVKEATTPLPLYPALTRPLLDAWSMTALPRHEGRPEVAPWLRGWEKEDGPQANVVWREHLPCIVEDGKFRVAPAMVEAFFECSPIHLSEELETKRSLVLDWVRKRAAHVCARPDDADNSVKAGEIVALVMTRDGKCVGHHTLSELAGLAGPRKKDLERSLNGATVVVDARLGGLVDGMLDDKHDGVPTVANADWPTVRFRVVQCQAGDESEGLCQDALDGWVHLRTFETKFGPEGQVQAGLAVYKRPDEFHAEDSRSVLSEPQTLECHAQWVVARVRAMAERLRVPTAEADALAIAARWHDNGKASERWQRAMNAPSEGRPYAKTSGGGNWRLLEGYRHEFGSLIEAESADLPEATRDLILHLIASHHGGARPLIGWQACDHGPPSLLEAKAGDVALRYMRLQKRYGPWGLAWLEAILRAADHTASCDWEKAVARKRAETERIER